MQNTSRRKAPKDPTNAPLPLSCICMRRVVGEALLSCALWVGHFLEESALGLVAIATRALHCLGKPNESGPGTLFPKHPLSSWGLPLSQQEQKNRMDLLEAGPLMFILRWQVGMRS